MVVPAPDRAQGLMDSDRHVMGCHSGQATRVQPAFDDVASNIRESLPARHGHFLDHAGDLREVSLEEASAYAAHVAAWRARAARVVGSPRLCARRPPLAQPTVPAPHNTTAAIVMSTLIRAILLVVAAQVESGSSHCSFKR
jgi:hypothetical protein